MKLNGRSGSAQLPATSLGKHRYRLAALKGKKVISQSIATINVFGEIPFSSLFGDGHEHFYTSPTFSFPYIGWWDPGVGRSANARDTVLQVKNNNCLSVRVDFVPISMGNTTLTLVQETRDPISANAPLNSIGLLEAELVPGQSWALTVVPTEPANLDFNGSAICDSWEPFEGEGT